ncbi:CH domain containing protein [Trichuris trichiura]|uniref:CH domain containing protein n=1 Tax=Trichuris trichiura TaxID=36087 RepID=A0A077Z367_TRITR|nr:CH domain containing protein [Trichuris trichiura]
MQIDLTLEQILEQKVKIQLPRSSEALADALSDGVVLCHFLNAIRPRTVAVVHLPSESSPCVPLAKARRNLENFLTGCRRLGVQEVSVAIICNVHPAVFLPRPRFCG